MLLTAVTLMLLAGTPEAPASNASAPVEKAAERKVCRRDIETGSLIKGKKICYTAKQWQQISDATRDDIESRSSSGSQSGQ